MSFNGSNRNTNEQECVEIINMMEREAIINPGNVRWWKIQEWASDLARISELTGDPIDSPDNSERTTEQKAERTRLIREIVQNAISRNVETCSWEQGEYVDCGRWFIERFYDVLDGLDIPTIMDLAKVHVARWLRMPPVTVNRYARADWCFEELARRYGKVDMVGYDGRLMDLAKDSDDDKLMSVVNEIVKDMIQADRL